MNKKCSVVIPTYNNQFFISNAIKSAVNQNYDKNSYEIIVVDDGSSDNTDSVMKTILDSVDADIKYFKKKNGGTASARNLGVSKASGEYIAFLDADDTYTPNKLNMSIDVLDKYYNVGIVYSDYVEKYPDHSVIRLKENFNIEKLYNQCIISTNSVVKKEALEKVGGFDESFRYVEDYDLWCRIVMSGFFALRLPEVLFIYNSHPQSKTNVTNHDKINPEWAKIRERILKNEWLIKR
jgi:glycosyltransferase involved in cell wall biosynthesis